METRNIQDLSETAENYQGHSWLSLHNPLLHLQKHHHLHKIRRGTWPVIPCPAWEFLLP